MKWRIVPVDKNFRYSNEEKNLAHIAALKAALDMKTEFVDVSEQVLSALGKKWELHFSFAYASLKQRFGSRVDDLILLADRFDKYASVYECTLRNMLQEKFRVSIKCEEINLDELPCGSLLAQHYNDACRIELISDTSFTDFPDTGDILEALSVNRVMQAALLIDSEPKRALDLLADSMASRSIYMQGKIRIESWHELRRQRKANAKKVASSGGVAKAEKLELLRIATINLYKNGKWDSAPLAAKEIQPKIVELSKKNGPQLAVTTSKPLQWIRDYKKSLEK